MANPDITPYIDLRIFDLDPVDVFENAKLALQTNLPEWVPRESNVEVVLLEALALPVAENIFAINRLPGAIVEVLLKLYGVVRSIGTPPTVNLRFTMIGNSGYTIPVGTTARLTLPGELEPVVFTTNTELNIAPGNYYGVVSATGDRYTSEANGVAAATLLELLDSILYVETVTTEADVAGGSDPETDEEYFARAIARFGRLSDALVLPEHFEIAALEQTYVKRAKAIDNWDGTGATPGTVAGHITVAVYGDGANLSAGQKSDLQTLLDSAALANLVVHIVDPTINTQAVTASVQALPGYDGATVDAAIGAALEAYLDPMQWGWGTTIRLFELTTVINNVEGVDYIISMTTPNANVALTGNAPLADAGTLTITVTEA